MGEFHVRCRVRGELVDVRAIRGPPLAATTFCARGRQGGDDHAHALDTLRVDIAERSETQASFPRPPVFRDYGPAFLRGDYPSFVNASVSIRALAQRFAFQSIAHGAKLAQRLKR